MWPKSADVGAKETGCFAGLSDSCNQEGDDQQHLQDCRDQLKRGGVLHAGELHDRDQPDHADREQKRRRVGKHRGGVLPERHRGKRHRCGKTDGGRHPSGQEAERGMIGAAQEIVLAARARKHRAQLAVGEHAAQRDHAADAPEQQDGKAGGDAADLEAEAGEHADADHVGNHDGRGNDEGDRGAAWENAIRYRRAPRVRCCHVGTLGPSPTRRYRAGGCLPIQATLIQVKTIGLISVLNYLKLRHSPLSTLRRRFRLSQRGHDCVLFCFTFLGSPEFGEAFSGGLTKPKRRIVQMGALGG